MTNRRTPFKVIDQTSGGGGAPGVEEPIAANEAAASAIVGLVDGQSVFILSHRSWWRFNANYTGALIAHVVIASASGGASPRLMRSAYADPKWRLFSDCYVDPSNLSGVASDENTAFFLAAQVGAGRAPLLTWQEYFRRVGHRNVIATTDLVNQTFRIHVLSNEPPASAAQDPWDLDWVDAVDTFPRILGEAAVIVLGPVALGAFTAQNPAVPAPGGTAATITVGATVWGPFLGKRIRRTSDGSVAVILKDLGAGVARISQPQLTNEPLFFATPTGVVWAAADMVVVENLTTVNAGYHFFKGFQGSALGFSGQTNIADLDFLNVSGGAGAETWEPEVDDNSIVVFYQCGFDRFLSQNTATILNSCALRLSYFGDGGGRGGMFGGAIVGPPFIGAVVWGSGGAFGFAALDFFTYVQGATVRTHGPATCGTFSVWDATVNAANPGGHALLVGGIANVGAGFCALALRSASPIFGSGSAGKGCRVAPGSKISAYQTLPNITGATGDLQLADSVLGQWGDFATGVYQPPGGLALTWAALVAAAGIAGFGGSVHNIAQDAHVNKAAAT